MIVFLLNQAATSFLSITVIFNEWVKRSKISCCSETLKSRFIYVTISLLLRQVSFLLLYGYSLIIILRNAKKKGTGERTVLYINRRRRKDRVDR